MLILIDFFKKELSGNQDAEEILDLAKEFVNIGSIKKCSEQIEFLVYANHHSDEFKDRIEDKLDEVRDLAQNTLEQLKNGEVPEFCIHLPCIGA